MDDICLGSSLLSWSFLASWVALVVKNLPAKAGDIGMWVRSLAEDPTPRMATHSSILA